VKHDLPSGGLATRPELRGAAAAIVLFGTIGALYFAREILIPFAFALTLTFLLSPVVALLQRLHVGRVVSVLTTLLVSIAVASSMGWIIAGQLVEVADQLPLYRQNIRAKIEAFHLPASGQLGQASASVKEIVGELTGPAGTSPASALHGQNPKQLKTPPSPVSPVPVRMVPSPTIDGV